MTGTSGRQRVQSDSVGVFEVAVPSDEIAAAFGGLVEPWFQKIKASAEESQTLTQLRDTLLPRLMSGEIRVREAEQQVEAAL